MAASLRVSVLGLRVQVSPVGLSLYKAVTTLSVLLRQTFLSA